MRKQSYPNQPTDDVLLIIKSLVKMKREGNFIEVNDRYQELADNEKNDTHNYPYILKSWAKVIVCLGKYDVAIEYFKIAANLFLKNGNNKENWQCKDQAKTIENRYQNKNDFINYVRAVSGGLLNSPKNFKRDIMTLNLNNFEEFLLKGYFINHYLTQEEATIAGHWISKFIVSPKRTTAFYYEWEMVNKSVMDLDYLTLLYTCVLSLQYFYDSYEPKQTNNQNVKLFCIELLRFIQSHDFEYHEITGRQYWAKLAQMYHVIDDFATELRILDEGLDVLQNSINWVPGMMTKLESDFKIYSDIELLLAQKAVCHLSRKEFEKCKSTIEIVLDSINMRGINDFENGLFPKGLKSTYHEMMNNN